MKTGIMFEYGDDIKKFIPYDYICETLLDVFEGIDGWNENPFSALTLSQKRRLVQKGISEDYFNSFLPEIKKAKIWYLFTGFNYDGYVLSIDEQNRWKQLTNICNIVNNID